jgi:hypothetical protein
MDMVITHKMARCEALKAAVVEVFGSIQRCALYHNVSQQAVYQWLAAGHIPINTRGGKPRLRHHMAAVKARRKGAKYPVDFWNESAQW